MTTIAEQADEVGREVRQRERLYPRWIAEGRIREDTAARKVETLKAAERSLRFIAQHATGLRALAHFLIAATPGTPPIPTEAERQALLVHPAVQALLAVWPDAEVAVLPPPPPPAQPELFTEPEEEREDA